MAKEGLAARLLATFLEELDEQVRVLNADLLALEAAPDDAERLRSVFRVAHTLKGAARAANVQPIEAACHALEGMLAPVRDGRVPLRPEQIAQLFTAADALADAGARVRAGQSLADSPLAALLPGLRSGRTPGAAAPGAPPPPPPARASAPAPGPAPAPAPAAAPPAPNEPPPAAAADAPDEYLRIAGYRLDGVVSAAAEVLSAAGAAAARPEELEALRGELVAWRGEWRRTAGRRQRALERAGVPPEMLAELSAVEQRLDRMAGAVRRLAEALERDARRVQGSAGRVIERARALRLRPFADVAEALPRAVRDVAAAVRKRAALVLHGQEVQADRAVLDALREPLLHLVRNAVDHGLEAADERERRGKPPQGTITVTAALAGARLLVTVADDGRGVDEGAVRARLARLGRPVPADRRGLAAALLEGGFSTRDQATAISGRGVGLDIVRAAVERLGGAVELTWREGAGTTFAIEAPLSLATTRALLVDAGGQRFAVPTAAVQRVLRPARESLRPLEGRLTLEVDGSPVPVAALAALLGPPLPAGPAPGDAERLRAVLLAAGARRMVVTVDEVVEERELVVRALDHASGAAAEHFAGVALLPDDRPALVVSAAGLLGGATAAMPAGAAAAAGGAGAAAAERRRRILVADDSITTRSLEESVLAGAGYDVATAVDGAQAWELLQRGGCDLLVSDIEMPRMDGLALCAAVRASKRLAALPVILVTSLDRPEDRQRGLEAGADAYISKSSFDQDELLGAVRQLLGTDAP